MAARMFGLLAEWRPRWVRKRAIEQFRDLKSSNVVVSAQALSQATRDNRRAPARHRPAPPPMRASNM